MPYCPKCGNKVEDTTTFCPHCGTQLKSTTPNQPTSTQTLTMQERAENNMKQENQEKKEQTEKTEKQGKSEFSFVSFLVGGLVMVTIGIFAILELTNPMLTTGQYLIIMLLTIGVIIIGAAIYVATSARKRLPLI